MPVSSPEQEPAEEKYISLKSSGLQLPKKEFDVPAKEAKQRRSKKKKHKKRHRKGEENMSHEDRKVHSRKNCAVFLFFLQSHFSFLCRLRTRRERAPESQFALVEEAVK